MISGQTDQSDRPLRFHTLPLSLSLLHLHLHLPPPPRGSASSSPRSSSLRTAGTFLIFLGLDKRRNAATKRREPKTRRIQTPHDSLEGHGRLMLGRGVKRKWSCLEELEVETLPASAEKKNGEEDQEDKDDFLVGPSKSDMSHLQQRQRVLGLCLEKLQRYQVGVELSLRRSVLLINTLRQIQEDMQSDGVGACTSGVLLNGVHSNSCILREDLPVTCPGCAEVEEDNFSPQLSSELHVQEANSSPDQPKSLLAATINAFSDAVNAMGYLSDLALDDIFEDIDTSMYETSDLPSAWASVSVSLWADEDVKMRSSSHASAGSLQSCLTDLNELDHIMEILVKS